MAIPPSGSDPHIALVGAEGGGEEGGSNRPLLGATGVSNSSENMTTGSGQIIEAAETQEPTNCLETCFGWFMTCLREAAEEAETSVAVSTPEGVSGSGDSSGKAEKAKKPGIPKPDTPGAPVDLTALGYDRLNAWPIDTAIATASGALENARQTACYQYWAYKAEPKPSRDRTDVDAAQRVLMQVVGLVRSFVAQKTETATSITINKLAPLGILATECEATHQQIEKKLGDPDETEEDKTEEAAPVEEAGGSDDTTEVGGGDPSDEEDPAEDSEPEQE